MEKAPAVQIQLAKQLLKNFVEYKDYVKINAKHVPGKADAIKTNFKL